MIDAILAHCQGHRRGSFARSLIELEGTERDRVSLDLPARMRVDRSSGEHLVVDGKTALRWTTDDAPRALESDELDEALALRELIGMALLQPLVSVNNPSRTGGERIAFDRGTGESGSSTRFELVYDAATDLPVSLEGPAGTVRFVALLDTGKLHVPQVVELGRLGRKTLQVVETDWRFDASVFQPPRREDRPPDIVLGKGSGTSIPSIAETTACSWLLLPDPGKWPARLELYSRTGMRLGAKGYTNAGDPVLVEEGEKHWFVVQFRGNRSDPEPVRPTSGEALREMPAQRCVSVHPEDGDFEDRVATGRAAVEKFIADKGLRAAGPTRVVVNLFAIRADDEATGLRIAPLEIVVPIEP